MWTGSFARRIVYERRMYVANQHDDTEFSEKSTFSEKWDCGIRP
jgi:hypothetical protein